MMSQAKFDPEVIQKRLGDGDYEQGMVRAQVAQLDADVAYSKTWNLGPGVALTPEQMTALTADIVCGSVKDQVQGPKR